ncbi:MAG TPA: YafY family transcriptional regulator [Anaerolineae bacterium]|nr:YafY family transcriptional regulator [Anaerolineae bacterium]
MGNVATRLLSIVLMLQSKPHIKAAEFAAALGVSERTVHRYMAMLCEMGIPIYSERGPYGGFSLVRGYKLPPMLFTAEEATVLYLGASLIKEMWGKAYRDAATAATAKLDNVLPDELRRQVDRAQASLAVCGLHRFDPTVWETFIDDLRRCVAERQRVWIRYRNFNREETERVVDPYGLALQWGLWYLVGYCHLRQDVRTFRVDRIQALELLEATFQPPPDFSVREFLATMARPPEPVYRVEVRFNPDVAPRVVERSGTWQDLIEHPDGSVTVAFPTANLDWPTWWVLSYGAAARVISPPELAERVRQAAEAVVRIYAPRADDEESAPARE